MDMLQHHLNFAAILQPDSELHGGVKDTKLKTILLAPSQVDTELEFESELFICHTTACIHAQKHRIMSFLNTIGSGYSNN